MKNTLHAIALSAAAVLAIGGCDTAPPPAARPTAPSAAGAPPAASAVLTYDSLLELIEQEDDFAKARHLGEVLPSLGPESLPAVKEALEEAAELEMDAVVFELLMRYWTLHDPEGAAHYALGKSPRAYKFAAVLGAVVPWVKADPQKTLSTMRPYLLMDDDLGTAAQLAFVRGWYASGTPGLEQFIHDLGPGFARQRALTTYAGCVIRDRGAEAIVKWAESIPDTESAYKVEAFRKIGFALVAYDVPAAKRFCEKHCEGPFGNNLRLRIADRWSREKPADALDWLADAPDNQDSRIAVRVSFAIWGSRDRPAAIRWMKERIARHATGEPPQWLEPSMPIYARLLAKDSPSEGLEVARRLKDRHEANVVMVELAHAWYHERDQVAAEAWLRSSPLNEALRAMVRSPERPAVKGGEGEQPGTAKGASAQR